MKCHTILMGCIPGNNWVRQGCPLTGTNVFEGELFCDEHIPFARSSDKIHPLLLIATVNLDWSEIMKQGQKN